MKSMLSLSILSLSLLSGCAGMRPPSADTLATLPVVTYPETPLAGDYVYRLPAGQPIEMRVLIDGSVLAGGVDQTVSASLARDLYLHRQWASEDGRTWVAAEKLVGVNLDIALPSYEMPGPGRIHLTVDRLVGSGTSQ